MSFSLSEFRDFCASKPEGKEYLFQVWTTWRPSIHPTVRNSAWDAFSGRPRTYGALTARLDALMGEKK